MRPWLLLDWSGIRDQCHLYLNWIFQRTRIQICWFQLIVFLKIFEAFNQLCSHVCNCYYSLIVYYLCVMFLLVISNRIWQDSRRHPIARTPMKWIKSTAVKTLLGRSLAGPAFWLLSPISFYFQEYQISWAIIIAKIFIWWYCSSCSDWRQASRINDSLTWWIENRVTTIPPLRRKVSRWQRASSLCLLHR